MKFGVTYNTGYYGAVDPDAMTAVARHAEHCGFESFYVPEHVTFPLGATADRRGTTVARISRYPPFTRAGLSRRTGPCA